MPQMTIVIHIRDMQPGDVLVDRQTIFGNPFRITTSATGRPVTREHVLKAYRGYFWRRINLDPDFKRSVLELKGKRLACHCAPLACHANVIAEYLNGDTHGG